MSDEVGGADVRDRVLAGGARAMANVRSRTAAPPPPPAALPLPPPRRSLRHRAALSRARRVRNAAHPIRRSGCCWRDQREDLGVGPFVRATIHQEAHPREEGLDLGVVIGLGNFGRRVATLRRGHAENEGGGVRVVSGERDGEVRTTMAQQTGARAPPSRHQ